MTAAIKTEMTPCSVCGSGEFRIAATGKDYIYHGTNAGFQYVCCTDCGHYYLNPRPAPSSISLMYPANYGTFSNRFRASQSILGRVKTAVNQRRIGPSLAVLPLGAKVLDAGCGNGELLLAIRSKRPDLHLTGLDWHFPEPTRAALEAAAIVLIESPLESAKLADMHFDMIMLLQLIEHLWEPEKSVQRMADALKPGGHILIETPNTDGWDRRFFADGAWGGYYFPRHLNLYNFQRLADLLRKSGLSIVSQKNLPAPLIWIYSLQALVQQRFGWRSKLSAVFGVKNLLLIGFFAVLDMAAAAIGMQTSNQQAVAIKPVSLTNRNQG